MGQLFSAFACRQLHLHHYRTLHSAGIAITQVIIGASVGGVGLSALFSYINYENGIHSSAYPTDSPTDAAETLATSVIQTTR